MPMSSILLFIMFIKSFALLLILGILWTKATNGFCSTPHFHVAHSFKFLVQAIAIVGLRVGIDRNLSLVTCLYRVVEPLHNWLDSLTEARSPIESTTLCCCRTVGIHPIHTLLSEQRHQALCQLFNCLIESLRWRVTVFAENLILSLEQTFDGTHQ